MPGKAADPQLLTVALTPVEHAAVLKAAETGLAVIEALGLVQNTGAMAAPFASCGT